MGIFEITLTKYGEYQFQLIADNGQIILNSECYITKKNCLNSIASIRRNAKDDTKIKFKTISGKFYFELSGTNGQIIGRGLMHESLASLINAIEFVRSFSEIVLINDRTLS
ncbi:YegP family protein [Sphingobacterium multivorum]|uniref:YegP family protein n=1 Tax=Sphingobacterium multivorum TaxID=28454 RepID=A0ABX7CUX7_SPHMU|nr:YegP family protein [Sphingobacterium multivorum]QQT33173.1 YegP family protein [Sphingobacterium multivorum]QQT55891.1 YegP family protein [Sphingobacterium multivorum]